MGMFNISMVDTLTKKLADATAMRDAAITARDLAAKEAGRVRADVASRSFGGVTSPADQLSLVLAQRAQLEAEDAARRAESHLSIVTAKLGVARKEPEALARDPETLLGDLSKISKTIEQHEAALQTARSSWTDRLSSAQAAFSQAEQAAQSGGARPLPIPASCDEVGRPLSEAACIEALTTIVAGGFMPAASDEQLRALRTREKELRATLERTRIEEQQRHKERGLFVSGEKARHADADRENARYSAEVDRMAKAVADENDRLAASHVAHASAT